MAPKIQGLFILGQKGRGRMPYLRRDHIFFWEGLFLNLNRKKVIHLGKRDQLSELEAKAKAIEKKLAEIKEFVGSFGKWFNDQNKIIESLSDRQAKFEQSTVGAVKALEERLQKLEERLREVYQDQTRDENRRSDKPDWS
jgi:hypothetical protein